MNAQLKRKRRKPRLKGTACAFGRRCIAVYDVALTEDGVARACPKHAADVLFSRSIRDQAHCSAAGDTKVACNGGLQCAHVRSRRYTNIRWDKDNAMALCAAHHVYFTHHPLEWEYWCRESGIPWDRLREQALFGEAPDPNEVVSRLLDREGAV